MYECGLFGMLILAVERFLFNFEIAEAFIGCHSVLYIRIQHGITCCHFVIFVTAWSVQPVPFNDIDYDLLYNQCTNCTPLIFMSFLLVLGEINRIYDGVEAETRKSQASFQII